MEQDTIMNLQTDALRGHFGWNSLVKGAFRLLGLLMIFGMVQVQAETQNKITALSVSEPGAGTTVIKVELAEPLPSVPAGIYHQHAGPYCFGLSKYGKWPGQNYAGVCHR